MRENNLEADKKGSFFKLNNFKCLVEQAYCIKFWLIIGSFFVKILVSHFVKRFLTKVIYLF